MRLSVWCALTFVSLPAALGKTWVLKKTLKGTKFLDAFNYETKDWTNGVQSYNTRATLEANGLINVDPATDAVTLKISTKAVEDDRKSFRLASLQNFNGGLFLWDIAHVPVGCGNWPAIWMLGEKGVSENWPNGGELDLLEGVHQTRKNLFSAHTRVGCTMPYNSGYQGQMFSELPQSLQNVCASSLTGNMGCGVQAKSTKSYGAGFNSNGGGYYALEWTVEGIRMYFWERNNLPADLKSSKPTGRKAGWGVPQNFIPADDCDPFSYFYDMKLMINNCLCGDWAGNVWSSDLSGSSQSQSCATITKTKTCAEYVRNNGGKFKDSYFTINSLKIYNWQ